MNLNFESKIEKILDNVKPGIYSCQNKEISQYCEKEFELNGDDIIFLKKFKVPFVELCTTCRRQLRYAFINQIDIYKKVCSAPGHYEEVISTIPPISPYKIYDTDYFRNASWSPMDYGIRFDLSKSFFEQLHNLRLSVPHIAITGDPASINSEYSVNGKNLRNAYRVTGGRESENIWYTVVVFNSKEIMDGFYVTKSENCYEIVISSNCYNCDFVYFSDNCMDSSFLYDCKNCSNCIGGINLRNAKYVYFGEQLTKEQYEEKTKEFSISSIEKQDRFKKIFWNLVKNSPVRAERVINSVNSTGVLINNSKDCIDGIGCFGAENTRHCDMLTNTKESMNASTSSGGEGLYETISVGSQSANIKFSVLAKGCSDSDFLINCTNCVNCFGCVGLENKSYCLLNQQYTKEEYYKLVEEIKCIMLESGEYGRFLPIPLSCFAYNGSNAHDSFPVDKDFAIKIGSTWQEERNTDLKDIEVVSKDEIFKNIKSVNEKIIDKAIKCSKSNRPFRIIKSELEFLQKRNIALPSIHPKERMLERFSKISSYRKYENFCKKCNKKIFSIYKPEDNWITYCDTCYQHEVV